MGTARIVVSLGGGRFEVIEPQRLPALDRLITGNFFADPQLSGTGPVADVLAWSRSTVYWFRLNSDMKLVRRDFDDLAFEVGRMQVAGNFTDRRFDDVFFLDEFQRVAFVGTTGDGDFARVIPEPFVSQVSLVSDNLAYSRLAKGRFAASRYDSLFLYSPLDHGAAVYTTDGRGIPVRINGTLRANRFPVLQHDYRSVLSGRFLTNGQGTDWDEILLYRATTGRGSICTTDGFGDLQATGLLERSTVALGADAGQFWRTGNFTGNALSDLLTYNSDSGRLSVHSVDRSGNFQRAGGVDVGEGWEMVQTGRFSSGGFTDLLLFRS